MKKKKLIRALRGREAHPDLTVFRLCQEFGWTPAEARAQRATDIDTFALILGELDRLARLVPQDEDATTILIEED